MSFIETHLDLGMTTVDHADIYSGYQCEAALARPERHLTCVNGCKSSVKCCGIAAAATRAAENVIDGIYITGRVTSLKGAERSAN